MNCRPKKNCRIKFWLVFYQLFGRASPNFILQFFFGLQFTFSCNSLVHDPGLLKFITFDHKKYRNAIINSNYNMTASFLFPQFDLYNIHIDPRISRTMHTLSPVKFRDLNLPRHIVTSYQLCAHTGFSKTC